MFENRRDFVLALTVECGIAYRDLFGKDEAKDYLLSKNLPISIVSAVMNGLCQSRRIGHAAPQQ
jgi:hypothetical protein